MFNFANINLKNRLSAWVAAFLVIIIAFIAVTYIIINYKGANKENPTNLNQKSSDQTESNKPTDIFTMIGTINGIENGQIKILAKAGLNNLPEDLEVDIMVDENTTYSKLTFPIQLPKDIDSEKIKSLFKNEAIKFNDLDIGQKINISANSDISEVTSFTATAIQIQNAVPVK